MWEPEKIVLFLLFFIPGFISIKVYQLLVPTEKIDFSKALYEAVGYSSINYGFFIWLILIITDSGFRQNHTWLFYLAVALIMFISPALWSILFVFLSKTKFFSRYFIDPVKNPWDAFFQERKGHWILVHLKNGKRVMGRYGVNSFASSYPREPQLYLEEIYKLEPTGYVKIKNTAGMLFLGSEISLVEFFN